MSIDMNKFIDEAVVVTGIMARPSSMQGYVNLFFTMVSSVTKSYKKESNPQKYINGCGKIYDPTDSTKKLKRNKINYTLLNEIVLNKKKVVYTLKIDIDSQNALIQYRTYKNKAMRPQYLAIMLAKKNIVSLLKQAGFSVKTDQTYIYATAPNFIQEPGKIVINGVKKDFGNLIMNDWQIKLQSVAKSLFNFEEIYPGQNKYSIKLKMATLKKEISDENRNTIYAPNATFSKVILSSNGTIKVPSPDTNTTSMISLIGAFEPIVLDNKKD